MAVPQGLKAVRAQEVSGQGCEPWGSSREGKGVLGWAKVRRCSSANTQTDSSTLHCWDPGALELSPSPFWLLGLEIRELLLISPQSCPCGAPLSLLLTGEMSKAVVTTMLCSMGWGGGF